MFNTLKESVQAIEARLILIEIANDYQNNYLTPLRYAECNALTLAQAEQLLSLAQSVRASVHPEA